MQVAHSRSFHYRKAMPQQEKGGQTWRVVKDVVKHQDGMVTNTMVEGALRRQRAMQLARVINLAL